MGAMCLNIIDTVGGAQCEKNPPIFLGCGPGERVCIKIYAPICGSDRKTYGNRCWFDLAKRCDDPSLTTKHEGECVSTTGTFYFVSKYGRCLPIFCKMIYDCFLSISFRNLYHRVFIRWRLLKIRALLPSCDLHR